MPTTIRNTDILFNDSTTQSTASPAGGISYQAFTSSGTFTIPTGVTKVKVTVVGGGGGGGGAFGSGCTGSGSGGGGGAGSTAYKWLTGLTPGNTIGVTVGGGGTAGASGGGTAGSGGSSSIQSGTQTITTVTALGGLGGAYGSSSNGAGGQGQTPTNGDINITGDDGEGNRAVALGGRNSLFGSTNSQSINAIGLAANLYGNGGNAGNTAGGTVAGGAGSAGIVIFEW